MQLLRRDEEGNFSLHEYFGRDIPSYAILSHIWCDEEVTYQDMKNEATKSRKGKAGFRKLEFCGRQAAKDGLSFFWVDTCCIDKSSSAALTVAINSMFRWYSNAARCYVYLQDVLLRSDSDRTMSSLQQSKWFTRMLRSDSDRTMSSLQQSKWFTRSWTLQELLAPQSVEFFDSQGNRIGDKVSMIAQLQDITKIPHMALLGSPLSSFSVADRMSWTLSRRATREEDQAYSLLGIFDVHMPLLYGEGEKRAFKRLQYSIERETKPHIELNRGRAKLRSSTSFHYGVLAANGFRLLTLRPGPLGSKITGQIQEFELSDPPPYYALSYVWGQEPSLHQITIDDAIIRVRPNLFYALQRIRALQNYEISLWVDSISIDQRNDAERSAQVTRMAQIYNKAAGVYIWLGEEDATSKLAFELVDKIYDGTQDGNPNQTPFSWTGSWWKNYSFTALSLLMERSWFRRGWVLQEAAFSMHSTFQCGDRQLQLNHFAEVIKRIRSKFNTEPQTSGLLSSKTRIGTLMNFLDSPAVRLPDLIQRSFAKAPNGTILRHRMSLEMLVHLATFSETSNERDAIYTLLNLANDQSSISRHDQGSVIVPDYSKSTLSVYREFVLYCSSKNRSLDVLCRPWAPSPLLHGKEGFGDDQKSTHLPSWIVSREKLPYGDPSWHLKHRLHGNPLVGSPLQRIYNAHGQSAPEVLQGTDTNENHILSVKGFIVGRIMQVSSRMAEAIVAQEGLLLLGDPNRNSGFEYKEGIGTCWRTLCADRDGNGNPAPSSWQSAMEDLLDTLNGDTISSIDIEEILDTDIPEHVREYLLVVRDIIWNRRTFRLDRTVKGQLLVGLVPANARKNDHICIVYGCSVPVVLRKLGPPDTISHWKLVGDAYVHGIMDGECLESKYDLEYCDAKDSETFFDIS